MANTIPAVQAMPQTHGKHGHDADQKHAPGECMIISEKKFMRDHTKYSAISSWLFAIAGATNIGVLCALSSKVLMAAEQGKPIFKSNDPKIVPVMANKKYNRIALGMTGFGAACMLVSNWLESKKVVTEWQLGAGKMQRKANIAERELAERSPAADSPAQNAMVTQTSDAKWADEKVKQTVAAAAPAQNGNWASSVQPETAQAAQR